MPAEPQGLARTRLGDTRDVAGIDDGDDGVSARHRMVGEEHERASIPGYLDGALDDAL